MAIIDWYSRRVLSWRLSNTMDSAFCVDALREALERFPISQIFNTDQGSQFTAEAFTSVLRGAGVTISMDGKGRCIDNVFVGRVWRSLKYEEVFLHAYDDLDEARASIERYFDFKADPAPTIIQRSAFDRALDACRQLPRGEAQGECIATVIREQMPPGR